MTTLQFWLSATTGEQRVQLPVNPEQVSITSSHGYEDIQVTHLGEYTLIGEATLKEYSFSSFLPRDYHSGYCEYEEIPDPWETVETIEQWMKGRKPIRLTITGTPINTEVTIRSFNFSERAGTPGDIYYELQLKQFIHLEFRTIESSPDKATTSTTKHRPIAKAVPKTYVVIPGDTLWKIAQRTLGNGDRWPEIYETNKQTIGKNPDLIYPGQKLVIPQ